MKLIILLIVAVGLCMTPASGFSETRTYKETVTVKVTTDEGSALNKAREQAREMALREYLNETYKDKEQTSPLNLTADEKYVKSIEQLDYSSTGLFNKELTVTFRITINEAEVRSYLKRQGVVTGKNDDRRIFVMLIPGNLDSGDAPIILDNLRAEIRRSLAAAEYTVLDSDDQAIRDAVAEEPDYNRLAGQINKLADKLADRGEWLVLGKVDMDLMPNGSNMTFRTMMTGKAVNLATRDIMWEGNIDGASRGPRSEAKSALRLSAINGGKAFAAEVLGALNTKTLTQERRGARFEVIFAAGGDYKLERKILKLLKEDIKGLKEVSQKGRGKGDMVIDLMFVGKISDLVDLLLDNLEKEPLLKNFNPEIVGNKVYFKIK